MAGNQIAKLRKPLNFEADGRGCLGFFIACQVAGFKHPVHLCLRVNFFLYGLAVNLTPEFNEICIFLNVEAVRLQGSRTPLSVSLSKKGGKSLKAFRILLSSSEEKHGKLYFGPLAVDSARFMRKKA